VVGVHAPNNPSTVHYNYATLLNSVQVDADADGVDLKRR
jgi:hypothetical protein